MIWMDVDVALAEVPVNTVPLIDADDFVTIETGVAYNATGMTLQWVFHTADGNTTVTAVTPTSSGAYDWAHQGGGMYTIEIPASGGASINNNQEGFGYFTGRCDGVLPWRGPTIGFRAAGKNDLLVDGDGAGIAQGIKRGVNFDNFDFPMYDAQGNLAPGLTVDAARRLDDGSFEPCANSVSEVGGGIYTIDLDGAADLDARKVTLLFTDASSSSTTRPTLIQLVLEP